MLVFLRLTFIVAPILLSKIYVVIHRVHLIVFILSLANENTQDETNTSTRSNDHADLSQKVHRMVANKGITVKCVILKLVIKELRCLHVLVLRPFWHLS